MSENAVNICLRRARASADSARIMLVMKTILTRDFSAVSNDDIVFAVKEGWLPKRLAKDPLGLA